LQLKFNLSSTIIEIFIIIIALRLRPLVWYSIRKQNTTILHPCDEKSGIFYQEYNYGF